MKNEETLSIFSKFQKWITVTPNSQNRKRPLEKEKIKSMDKTSKIMPNWMQPKYSSSSATKAGFVSIFKLTLQGKKGKNLFMEDSLKSVFSIMDFRHNLTTKDETEHHQNKVPVQPKKFFDHDDGTRFVISKNKDMKIQ